MKPRGTLRLTCAVTFGERYLVSALAELGARYPELQFDVELSDRVVDLVEEGFDAAVRIGAIGSQNLVGRKIGETRLVCCAAPSYLKRRGEPKRPEDLSAHTCLTYEYASLRGVWPFRDHQGRDRSVKIAGPVNSNSGRLLAALAADGLGIVCEPDFIIAPLARDGRLVPLLRGFDPASGNIHVVYPSRRHLSAKVRAFAEFMAQRYAKAEWALPRVS